MRKEEDLVSIIVVNYNGKTYLKECFDSFYNLDYPASKIELIMVDNCSEDGSVEYIRRLYPRIQIINNDVNNYCRANNLGIKQARAKYIALVNNDVRVDKNWLKQLLEVINRDKDIGAVSSKVVFPDGKLQGTGHRELPDFYWVDRGYREADNGQYETAEQIPSLSGCSVLYKKSCLDDVGLLDEDFVMYLEDVDMSLRCKEKGWKLFYVPKSVAYHKFHGSANEDLVHFYVERNRLLLIAKYYPRELGRSLAGRGYFTQAGSNSHGKDIESVLPQVFLKLFKHHNGRVINIVLPEIFENLKKMFNLEKHNLVQYLDTEKMKVQAKEETISQKESQLAGLLEELRRKDRSLEEKDIQLKDAFGRLQQALQDLDTKEQGFNQKESQLAGLLADLRQKDGSLREKDIQLKEVFNQLQQALGELESKKRDMVQKEAQLNNLIDVLQQKDSYLQAKDGDIQQRDRELQARDRDIYQKGRDIQERDHCLQEKDRALERAAEELRKKIRQLQDRDSSLQEKDNELERAAEELQEKIRQLQDKDSSLQAKERDIQERDRYLQEKDKEIERARGEIQQFTQELESEKQLVSKHAKEITDLKYQINSFYSTETFRFVIRPLWFVLDTLKKTKKRLLSLFLRRKDKTAGARRILFIKPQRVSVEDTQKILKEFRQKYPDARFSLIANLLRWDYETLSQDEMISEKLLFCPQVKKFNTLQKIKLLFVLPFKRYDSAVALLASPDYRGNTEAKLMAMLTGAEKVLMYSPGAESARLLFKDIIRYVFFGVFNILFLSLILASFVIFVGTGLKLRKFLYKFRRV